MATNPATRATALLAGAAARLRDLLPVTTVLAQDVNAAIIDSFRKQASAVNGAPWKPLAPSTIKARRNKRKGSIKMLMDTGRMRAATNATGTRTGFQITSSTAYSAAQNFGSTHEIERKARYQPARGGVFVSRKSAGKRKRGATEVRFVGASTGTVTIPARPFLPVVESRSGYSLPPNSAIGARVVRLVRHYVVTGVVR